MDPAKQGEFDGACGLYSKGNALSKLFSIDDRDTVFYAVFWKYHQIYGDSEPLVYGIYRSRLNHLLKEVIGALDLPCHIKRPYWTPVEKPNLNDFKNTLETHFVEGVGILGYEYCKYDEYDYYSHWTVITRSTNKSMKTLDSDSESAWIPFSKCRMWDEVIRHKVRPYKISYSDLFLLTSCLD